MVGADRLPSGAFAKSFLTDRSAERQKTTKDIAESRSRLTSIDRSDLDGMDLINLESILFQIVLISAAGEKFSCGVRSEPAP